MIPILLYLVLMLGVALTAPWLVRWSCKASAWIFSIFSLSGFVLFLQYAGGTSDGEHYNLFVEWLPDIHLNFSLYFDGLTLFFALLVTGMGFLVFIFAGKYMEVYAHKERFFFYLLLFEFAMLGLILSGNLFTLFVFWELTSVSSYLLIGFNHQKPEARNAALQALLITVLGGLAMMAGFVLIGNIAGTLEIGELLKSGDIIKKSPLYLPVLILVFLGAFTKSAQFPFHFWLPGAMQAPSPVSAFLHSATMVKAGIYLLARLHPLLADTDEWRYILTPAGLTTMAVGAYLAYAQTDFKKLLAYTTISALGILVLLLGIDTRESVTAAVVFLLVHALYKGALFMVAGLIDKAAHTRDLRQLGGLYRVMPFTAVVAILSLLSMAGFPPMIGFIGKELIYEAKIALPEIGTLLMVVGVFTNVVMVAISMALIFRLFLGKEKFPGHKPKAPAFGLKFGPVVLACVSLLIGLFPKYFAELFLQPAVMSINPGVVQVKISLWHGFNQVLLVSIITVFAGVIFFIAHKWVNPYLAKLNEWVLRFRFADAFNLGLDWFAKATKKKTSLIQSGYQRLYLMVILLTTSALVWFQLIYSNFWARIPESASLPLYEYLLILVMLMAVLFTMLTSSRMAAIVALGVVGYGLSVVYMIYGATDLAITQILTETLLMVLFVILVMNLPKITNYSGKAARLRDAFIALAGGSFVTALLLATGEGESLSHVSRFYAENSLPQAYGSNIVNVILVDFRALDTLGEITVIVIAAIGVVSLLKLKPKGGKS